MHHSPYYYINKHFLFAFRKLKPYQNPNTDHPIQKPKHEGARHDHLYDPSLHLIRDFQRQCEVSISRRSYPRGFNEWIRVSTLLPLPHPISEVDLVTVDDCAHSLLCLPHLFQQLLVDSPMVNHICSFLFVVLMCFAGQWCL